MNIRYVLCIERITSEGNFSVEFEVPLENVLSEEDAIREAKRLKKCLKDNYIVCIIKATMTYVGYIITD